MNFIERSFWSHDEADHAQQLAKNKQLPRAIETAKKVVDAWSDSPGFWERQMRKVSINSLLADLKDHIKTWEKNLEKSKHLVQQGNENFARNDRDPWNTEALEKALSYYRKSLDINQDAECKTNQYLCQHKLQEKKNFQELFKVGKQQVEKRYYNKALKTYQKAQSLFVTTELTAEILTCSRKLKQESEYETVYNQAKELTKQGEFQSAIAQLQPAYARFPREDGKVFIDKLQTIIQAKEAYQQGLKAEQQEKWQEAEQYYRQAQEQLPDLTQNCSTRLTLIAIKTQQWSVALKEVNVLEEKQAQYFRGYIYLQQGDYQAAYREWKHLSAPQIAPEIEKLKTLIRRKKLALRQQIETAANEEQLEEAKVLSQEFLSQFGNDLSVEENLHENIEPRFQQLTWQTQPWQKLAQYTKDRFLEQKDITSLHNWAVASYYHAQADPEKIENWITVWCSAIANLSKDPALTDVPWLGNEDINYSQVQEDLQNLLGNTIDSLKEEDLNQYFSLRDQYRTDVVALKASSIEFNGLKIMPSCYQQYQDYFPKTNFPANLAGALYTNWGKAVAACFEGDYKRSFTLSPSSTPTTPAESFGKTYVSYYQGIYYLQNQEWRKAKSYVGLPQDTIRKTPEWKEEIDRLCEKIRREISQGEALEFAEFWYDLLNSSNSRSYYVEMRAETIQDQLADKKISLSKGKKELKELRKIDQDNITVSDLLKRINQIEEGQEIDRLLKNKDLEGAVRKARSSQDETIRYDVASICIEILLEGIKNRSLYREEIMQLARWAYSLCPNEPQFREIYRELGIR
ncbi:hypothetical protein FRE64_10050 [Euhalothece natronophila Z-M001]|uniref:Tetratricopeptide repeat protein n=1 Tax=Euhalothece natronophila Z-M001 TaxID=522448 RepID=A0A5B8NLT4_9CHRO|nr:hypothetical protein [Euhalothece natronophila]QDZ40263.1 hypothetical protein FRE64_10050 [Euhalothece natronophila Z-M001]